MWALTPVIVIVLLASLESRGVAGQLVVESVAPAGLAYLVWSWMKEAKRALGIAWVPSCDGRRFDRLHDPTGAERRVGPPAAAAAGGGVSSGASNR
jgi:hypothetical protein